MHKFADIYKIFELILKYVTEKLTIPRWYFQAFGVVCLFGGISIGGYFLSQNLLGKIFAAGDTTFTWDFSVLGDYTLGDATKIEVSGSSAKLMVQNYLDDVSTMALFHFDELSGVPVDSSSFANSASATGITYSAGKLNNAASFNGLSSQIQITDSSSLSVTSNNTLEAWINLTNPINPSSGAVSQPILDKGDYKMYLDGTSGKLTYELASSGTQTWTQRGGNEINRSWDLNGKGAVVSSAKFGDQICAGTGNATGDAEVWCYDSTSGQWTHVGGDVGATDVNGSWSDDIYEEVSTLVGSNDYLVAGLGTGASEAEVWRYNGTAWTQIGGDSSGAGGQSWANNYDQVSAMYLNGSTLYVGLGASTDEAEVWRCADIATCTRTSGWTKIGGDGTESGGQSWRTTTSAIKEQVWALHMIGTKLFVGLGNTGSASETDAEIWMCDTAGSCTTTSGWVKMAGDTVGSSWGNQYDRVMSMTNYGNVLIAGLGLTGGEAEVWRCDTGAANNNCTNAASWSVLADGNSTGAGGQSWGVAYEYIWDLRVLDGVTNDYLYVAVSGSANAEAEIWRCDLAATCNTTTGWSQIGGDGVGSSWPTAQNYTQTRTLFLDGTTLYAGIIGNGTPGEFWSYNGSTWTQLGGNHIRNSWGFIGYDRIVSMSEGGGYLYAGTGSAAGEATVWRYDGSSWQIIGGQGVNGGWDRDNDGVIDDFDLYETVESMTYYKGNLYVGLGSTVDDGQVFKWDGSSWTLAGGLNFAGSGWADAGDIERVASMTADDDFLYVGLGASTDDGEVWRYNGTSWTQIAGNGTATGSGYWTNPDDIETVRALVSNGDFLYAGLGASTDDGEVWQYTKSTSTWARIAGNGTVAGSGYWGNPDDIEEVQSLAVAQGYLYAGLGTTTGDAEVWRYSAGVWQQVAGFGSAISAWDGGNYEIVASMVEYNGFLYATLGNTANVHDGEVWRYDGETTWEQVGGDSINNGWATNDNREQATGATVYKGKLYVGLGYSDNLDMEVWSYGNNAYLQSDTSTFDAGTWYHLAATYTGGQLKVYLDGVEDGSVNTSVTVADNSMPLYIGRSQGSNSGTSVGYFEGLIDEVRVSNTARTSFTTEPYASDGQTVRPSVAVGTSGINNWETFAATETLNGGSINFRLSDDNGATWKYWNGSAWVTSSSISDVNDEATINTQISSFPVTSSGLLWQGVLLGDGNQLVTLSTVVIEATADTTAPTAPNALTALDTNGGSVNLVTDSWYNYSTPYFSWSGADDTGGSGIAGYYVYFGTDNTADPQTAGTFQVSATFVPSSVTSGTTYYLRIRSRDNAQNVSSIYAPFIYKYDGGLPSDPSTVTINPAGYSATNDFTFSWPAAADSSSGIAGYQYKTGAASGDLSDWSDTTSATSVNIPEAAYKTDANTFYLRTIDNAGNTSTGITATYYFGGDGPSTPKFLAATPTSSTTNSFAFSWQAPDTYSGNVNEITYCYTVNTLPSASTCLFTSPGATSITAGPFATQVGLNIFYVVAKNPATAGGSINYGAYSSVSFIANTSAPGIPRNLDVGDISLKSSETWRLALSWNAPESIGSGVSKYSILRSTDGTTFEEVATASGLSYVDTELEQVEYFYQVKACDSVNNCGVASTTVSETPTGKFTEAATLTSGPVVSGITTKKATITWTTSRTSDTKVQYGTSSGSYFTSEPSNSTQKTEHEIALDNLQPGTTYFYKTKWTDEDGNTGTSSEKTFATEAAPSVKDVKVSNIGLTQALVNFTVKGASKIKVSFGETSSFGGVEEITTSKVESNYSVQLDGLKDGTKYYYRINAYDEENGEYPGTTLDFETLPRPKISNVRIQQVKNTAQPTVLITWTTNTEVSSIVTYYPQIDKSGAKDEINLEPKKEHRVIIRGLNAQTGYELVVKGRDKQGNEGLSDAQRFTTSTDSRPPVISGLRIQGSTQRLQNAQNQVAQLVISWNTDEPATTQVEYGEGTGSNYPMKTQEDTALKSNHLVVISNLTPSKVYHLRAVSKDTAANPGNSQDNVTITPKETDSALDLVLNNLQQIFGFLGNLNQ